MEMAIKCIWLLFLLLYGKNILKFTKVTTIKVAIRILAFELNANLCTTTTMDSVILQKKTVK